MSAPPTTAFDRDDPPILGANPFVGLTRGQVAAALARLGQRVAVEPGAPRPPRSAPSASSCASPSAAATSSPPRATVASPTAAWRENPLFRRLMQAYLVENGAAHRVIDEVELDPKSRDRAHFAMSLLTEAVAPTNNLLTNPKRAGQGRPDPRAEPRRRRPHLAHDCVTTAACRRRSTPGRSPSARTSPSRPGRSCTAPRCSS